jgi:hypothetical protein
VTEQTGPEQGVPNPDTPGRDAEDVSGSSAPGAGSEPSQEELRARLEDQIRKLKVTDLLVESTVSVLNLTARRIAKEDERDLEQARIGIDAVRAWVDLLPEDAAGQIRNALSELQMLYAQAAEGKPLGSQPPEGGEGEDAPAPQGGQAPPGPAESQQPPPAGEKAPPRLWTPPGTN